MKEPPEFRAVLGISKNVVRSGMFCLGDYGSGFSRMGGLSGEYRVYDSAIGTVNPTTKSSSSQPPIWV